MDCTVVDLVAYQIGGIAEDDRSAVEAHLVECRACLGTYLAIKRAADRAAAAERPRPEVKARLRAEVARAFPPKKARPVSFLGRRIPLYQGFALAAAAAAIAIIAPSVRDRFHPNGAERAPLVDTSRTRAESLSIY